jgi:dTDP-4-dehydrorhamnose 3,5-epimerase
MVYVPGDCAHGLQTLTDDTEIFCMVPHPYAPDSGRGVRWNDPAFGVVWRDFGAPGLIERD